MSGPAKDNDARQSLGFNSVGSARAETVVLTPGHSQESLTRAYIHALAGQVGLTCSHRDFDYGIDLTLHQVIVRVDSMTGHKRYFESGMPLDIQVKSTARAVVRDGMLVYHLEVTAYDDLRAEPKGAPRILVVHLQPTTQHERLRMTPGGLVVGGTCYWMSLRGLPSVLNRSRVRIRIPQDQILTEGSLKEIVGRIGNGEKL